MAIKKIQVADKLDLVIQELDDVCDSVTGRVLTGSWIWDSAVVLSRRMATTESFDFRGKSVIELGAGAGLPGLTAALLGAKRVVLTDVESLLPALLNNVEANGLGDRVEVRRLVWGMEDETESLSRCDELGQFDLVLMSDVFYDTEEMVGLGKTLKRVVCGGKGTRIWAASQVRPWTGECLNELTSQGFTVAELSIQLGESCSLVDDGCFEMNAIFELTPPNEVSKEEGECNFGH